MINVDFKEEDDESEESEMSDSGEDEKLTEEEREKKRHRNSVLEDRWFLKLWSTSSTLNINIKYHFMLRCG